jgi:hypothetical protein
VLLYTILECLIYLFVFTTCPTAPEVLLVSRPPIAVPGPGAAVERGESTGSLPAHRCVFTLTVVDNSYNSYD